MNKLKWYLAIWVYCLPVFASAQYSFEHIIGENFTGILRFTIESEVGYFSLGVKQYSEQETENGPLIFKFGFNGEILDSLAWYKQDTSFGFSFGFLKDNGNLMCGGTLKSSEDEKYDVTYLCEINQNLELEWEKMYQIPIQTTYSRHDIHNFLITPDSHLILEGSIDTTQYSDDKILFLSKYDLNGNQITFNIYHDWNDNQAGSELINKKDGSGISLIGSLTYTNMNLSYRWIEFDYNLNILDYGNVENNLSYCYLPLSLQWLSDGNLVMANKSFTISGGEPHDLEMRIMDSDYNIIKDTIIYFEEWTNIADHRGIGFTDENSIWVVTYEMAPLWLPGNNVFRIYIFDSQLNVKGMKVLGGKSRYWFFDLLATSDGGCFLTGALRGDSSVYTEDIILTKLMPDDIITSIENHEPTLSNFMEIHPNPFHETLYLRPKKSDVTFRLFDSSGRRIHEVPCSGTQDIHLKTELLKPGFYYYHALNYYQHIVQTGKLIKH